MDIVKPLCSFIDAKCRELDEKMLQIILIVFGARIWLER